MYSVSPSIKHINHDNHVIQVNPNENKQSMYAEDVIHNSHTSNLWLKQAALLGLWYLFSFFTIVLNKYILTVLEGDAGLLGRTQMLMSVIFGGFTIYLLPCFVNSSSVKEKGMKFIRNMSILGVLR